MNGIPGRSWRSGIFEENSRYFRALRSQMPEGMKAVGGVGNGIFECVQELTGFQGLCYIGADDEELYADLFRKVGELHQSIWKRFMREFGDIYCVLRFGDDLGYKSNSLLSTDDIRMHIFPGTKRRWIWYTAMENRFCFIPAEISSI